MLIAVVCALSAAAANALASVLQRRAAKTAPSGHALRPALVWDLVRRPVWLGGIVSLTAAFLFQATALYHGGLALVQPLLSFELPFTMLIAAKVGRLPLDARAWAAVATMTSGLVLLLAGAAPKAGNQSPGLLKWLLAGFSVAVLVTLLTLLGRALRGPSRAASFGIAAGLGFALTAALMNGGVHTLSGGVVQLLTAWQIYTMAATGLCSLFLLQNALQAGTLAAAQPALTVTDPVASITLGVFLFGEHVRGGPWIAMEAVGIFAIVYGSILLTRTKALQSQHDSEKRERQQEPQKQQD